MNKFCTLAVLLLLAGCGTLPEPFYGNPGPEGARLAQPPPPVLVIPPPTAAMLDDKSAALFAADLATALANNDVPSIARAASKQDWRLTVTATLRGASVLPAYAITGPDGKSYGTQTGAPVDAAAWANGDTTALASAAATDTPALVRSLTQTNARVQQSNPNSLENRPPRLFMGAVTGAPGDGDTALAFDMARDLPGPDVELVQKPGRADFTITGLVKTQPVGNGQLLVELDWIIHDTNNREIGQVTQLHQLSPTDITPVWGDVAAAAATEAATGVHEAINNARLHKIKPAPR